MFRVSQSPSVLTVSSLVGADSGLYTCRKTGFPCMFSPPPPSIQFFEEKKSFPSGVAAKSIEKANRYTLAITLDSFFH
jgi:hypothetical protein